MLVASFLLMATSESAFFRLSFAQGGCLGNAIGVVHCAPPNGGIEKDALGQLVCGLGRCAKDALGQVFCSKQSGGGAIKNVLGQVVCVGGCEPARASYCQSPE